MFVMPIEETDKERRFAYLIWAFKGAADSSTRIFKQSAPFDSSPLELINSKT